MSDHNEVYIRVRHDLMGSPLEVNGKYRKLLMDDENKVSSIKTELHWQERMLKQERKCDCCCCKCECHWKTQNPK